MWLFTSIGNWPDLMARTAIGTQAPFEVARPILAIKVKSLLEGLPRRFEAAQRVGSLRAGRAGCQAQADEKTYFFALLRRHTIEGMFCDPVHGGNVDMVGWQMLAFRVEMSYREAVNTHFGEAYRPRPASLLQISGFKIRPSEDEK